jgi:hypothetical protein
MNAVVAVVWLQLQESVVLWGQLDMFQFPHRFLEVVQVQEQGVHHLLVVVLERQELCLLYTEVKILIILHLIHRTL